jgi:hypothetical protein
LGSLVSRTRAPVPREGPEAGRWLYCDRPICRVLRSKSAIAEIFLAYDLPGIDPAALRFEAAGNPSGQALCGGLAACALFQPPAISESGRSLDLAVPANICRGHADTVRCTAPLLVLQRGGWLVGGFLARSALRRQQERFRIADRQAAGKTWEGRR